MIAEKTPRPPPELKGNSPRLKLRKNPWEGGHGLSPDMAWPLNFPLPEFFPSFRAKRFPDAVI
jgi:hypothetical protein